LKGEPKFKIGENVGGGGGSFGVGVRGWQRGYGKEGRGRVGCETALDEPQGRGGVAGDPRGGGQKTQ